jgi:hypothetical protein
MGEGRIMIGPPERSTKRKAPAGAPRQPKPRRPRAEPEKAECHFRAEMASEVALNKTAAITVTIAREALAETAGPASASASAVVETARKLIVEIVASRNLRVEGARRKDVEVPGSGDQVKVPFNVRGLHKGDGEISVQVRQASAPLVTLELRPRIVERPAASAAPLVEGGSVAALQEQDEALDELRIIEQSIGDTVSYLFLLDLASLDIREEFESAPLPGARDEYLRQILNEIGDSWAATGTGGMESFERNLRAIGAKMFDQLLPPKMQELLWAERGRIRSVQVFSREPFVPWELVYIKNPAERVAPENSQFLGELGLLRWIYRGYPPVKLRVRTKRARYVIPEYGADLQLPQSADEIRLLKTMFKAIEVPARLNEIERLLATPDSFDLLHFCGHGEAAGTSSTQARLLISGQMDGDEFIGDTLRATTVEQTAQLAAEYRPIVVLNACESARRNREFTGMGGFADAFVKAGAGAFIGTHWSVGDAPAYTFIEALYKAFRQSRPSVTLSEAVRLARQTARGKADATWLAYVVYGHPRATVAVD